MRPLSFIANSVKSLTMRAKPTRSAAMPALRRLAVVVLLCAGIMSAGWYGSGDSLMYRIGKSIETFAEVYRHVNTDYVDDIDPERVARIGIDAMLASLDPYSNYMDEVQSDDFDAQISGRYVGLGITVASVDSMLTVTNVAQGYSAHAAGLRVGDKLLSVDGTNVLRVSSKDLRRYTRGERGTSARVAVLREGRRDTLWFQIQRSDIMVRSVTFAERRSDGVVVIKLERFTRRTAQEAQLVMDSLRAMGPLRGIILDLRDNPGGVLDAAVGICEMFTKTGSMIVSTKGRNESMTTVYRNNSVPYEAECPMAVLINNASASASEVVAGCLQDNDRAVICGEQSFGKGLVQSQFPTPYGTTLKLTTQRYYCPSGRCIQRRTYAANGAADTLVVHQGFTTLNRRPMRDASGVWPDTAMLEAAMPSFVRHLVIRGIIARVATRYAAAYDALPASFDAAQLMSEIEAEALREGSDDIPVQKKLSELAKMVEADSSLRGMASKMSSLQAELDRTYRASVKAHAELIASLVRKEVMSRFMGDMDFLAWQMRNDDLVQRCARMLLSGRHESLLKPDVATR